MSDIMIRKFQMLDLADFETLCDNSDWYYPKISTSPAALLKYDIYRENCYVAYDGSTLIGYVYGGVLCNTLYPQFMFVREDYRKQGIGMKLMGTLEENSGCTVSLIYYNKELSDYYCKQSYEIGTNLQVGMKQIGGEPHEA